MLAGEVRRARTFDADDQRNSSVVRHVRRGIAGGHIPG
jgi:hypothetical protein